MRTLAKRPTSDYSLKTKQKLKGTKQFFHLISYLQYPSMLIGLYYVFKPYFLGFDTMWGNYNNALVFIGLGISLSTLQDTAKTQNKLSKRIWESPKKGKTFILLMSLFTFFVIALGIYGLFAAKGKVLNELYFGLIVVGVGLMIAAGRIGVG